MPQLDPHTTLRYRFALQMVCLVAGVLVVADQIGVVPDARNSLLQGRVAVVESLAASGTAMVADGDSEVLQSTVSALVDRNNQLRSVRLVDSAGNLLFETEGHTRWWSDAAEDSDSRFVAPIYRFGQPWGELQIAFSTIDRELSLARYGIWGLIAFGGPIWFVLFLFSFKQAVSSETDRRDDTQNEPDEARSVASKNVADANTPPIHTTLPIEDEELRKVVVNFIDRLDHRLSGMEAAVRHANFETLRSEAHWLKGSGGTVGFGEFTEPAIQLEHAARNEDAELALGLLKDIQSIRERIVAPVAPAPGEAAVTGVPSERQAAANDASPIICRLPMDDEEYREIVVEFIGQLDVRLMGMLSLLQRRSFNELESEAHWLKGAGGTVGFPALSEPALSLMRAAAEAQVERCQKSLRDLLQVRQRLVIPQNDNPLLVRQQVNG